MASDPAWDHSALSLGGAAQLPSLASKAGQLLTIEQVAEFLGVSPRTVRRLMRRGLPSVRFGRLVRFEQRDLLRWVEARKEA